MTGKSERQIVAWVIAKLAEAHAINTDPRAIVRAAHEVGVTVPEVHAEWRTIESVRWFPSGDTPTDDDTVPTAPTVSGAGFTPRGRRLPNMRTVDGVLERRCSRCRDWKPATGEYFRVIDRTTGRLKSMCIPCLAEYQRTRYLGVRAHGALGDVGLAFTIVDDDPVIACKGCGVTIGVGDDVSVDGVAYHTACHPDRVVDPSRVRRS